MKINIKKRTVEIPVKIEIDGKNYPITQWNINIIREYEKTTDVLILNKLKDFSLIL